jgi:hypothetical protein
MHSRYYSKSANKYPPKKKGFIVNDISTITDFFTKILDASNYSWIWTIATIRNKIVHRGFSLRPVIGFQKLDNLVMQTYRGTDFYTDIDKIDIGETMKMAIKDIQKFEEEVTLLLLNEMKQTIPSITHNSSYRYSDLINEYSTKEI